MKTFLASLAALFLVVHLAGAASAQTRTVRHPETGSPAITIDLPGDWTTRIDPDKNLIIAGPDNTVAFSITVTDDDGEYTVDDFARDSLDQAGAKSVAFAGEGLIPPLIGNDYTAKIPVDGQTLNLRMLIVRSLPTTIISATMITGPQTSAESAAVGRMILKTVRAVP